MLAYFLQFAVFFRLRVDILANRLIVAPFIFLLWLPRVVLKTVFT